MITSRKNPKLQFLRDLINHRKAREDSGLFILEGVRLIEDALINNGSISEIFFSENLSQRGMDLIQKFRSMNLSVEEVDLPAFQSVMETSHSQGIAAICHKPIFALPEDVVFIVVADQLRDPGNLGTLLRTAASAGAQAVITSTGTVDLFSPKVVRSGIGAHFHLACQEMSWDQINILVKPASGKKVTVFSAAANSPLPYWNCDFTNPLALVVGNEAEGISSEAYAISDHSISIPMPGHFESLNAAVAAGIIIFEAARQRSLNN